MGHRGSGKSTELSLLKESIKTEFEVISFNIQSEVDAGNMTYIDFIFAIMSQIIHFIENNPDIHLDEKDQISMTEARRVYFSLKNRYERLIRNDMEVEKLVQIYEDPQLLTTDDTMMELLLKGLALEYNGERWCGLHPTVEDFLKEKGKISG